MEHLFRIFAIVPRMTRCLSRRKTCAAQVKYAEWPRRVDFWHLRPVSAPSRLQSGHAFGNLKICSAVIIAPAFRGGGFVRRGRYIESPRRIAVPVRAHAPERAAKPLIHVCSA
jgi:hypothetical protein